jgi:uroporphyrinogen-III synthase
LFGARVLVPRGLEQAGPFAHTLAELGAEPVIVPVTRLAPPDPAERAHLNQLCARLDDGGYDWLVFTSANAVARFFDELRGRGRDARALAGARLACVGQATARALEARGLLADLVPARGTGAGLARALIDAAGASIHGLRVLLPRAAQGRDEAREALRAAGAEVDIAVVYRTETVSADEPVVRHGLGRLARGDIDIVTFFAPSQVEAVLALAGALGSDGVDLLRRCRLVAAIGGTTRDALAGHGIDVQVVAPVPDAEALAGAIAGYAMQDRGRP